MTSRATPTRLLTAEQFSRLPNPRDGARQELVKGEVVTMSPPSHIHGRVQLKIGKLLDNYLDLEPRGQVTSNSGIIIETEPDTVRGPDIAYWSIERMPLDAGQDVYPKVAPDLCVEVISPGNRLGRIREKIRDYFASGVRMVWLLYPEARTVTIYRSADEGRTLWEDATITGEDVLPGFSCPIASFFPPVAAAPPLNGTM